MVFIAPFLLFLCPLLGGAQATDRGGGCKKSKRGEVPRRGTSWREGEKRKTPFSCFSFCGGGEFPKKKTPQRYEYTRNEVEGVREVGGFF